MLIGDDRGTGAPRMRPPAARMTAEDSFGRMDTAPLDLSGLQTALDGVAARVTPAPTRWLRWTLGAVGVLLLAGVVLVVLALLPSGRGLPSPAVAAPGSAAPTTADTGWQGLELTGGWSATGDGARYRVRDGVCYLQVHAIVRGGTWPADTEVAVLPASAAPAWNLGFSAVRAGQPFGEVKVLNTGRILVVAPSSSPGGDITVSGSFPVG
jgi:hypothetical protein